MDLTKRKRRLAMFLDAEPDRKVLTCLKNWYPEFHEVFMEKGVVGAEDSERLIKKHFPDHLSDKKDVKTLKHVINLLFIFEDVVVQSDGLTYQAAGEVVAEIVAAIPV